MKKTEFKEIIKEAVKEAIHEELKDILLEAIKSSKTSLHEHGSPKNTPPNSYTHPGITVPTVNMKETYASMLGDNIFTTDSVNVPFRPSATTDTINGSLPPGEVSMDQIFGLINSK